MALCLWVFVGAIHSAKVPTGPMGKSGPPQKVVPFFRNFSGWTEPIRWVLDRNFRKFGLNGSCPVASCVWISVAGASKVEGTMSWCVGTNEILACNTLISLGRSRFTVQCMLIYQIAVFLPGLAVLSSVSPRSLPLGTYCEKESLRLSDRNSMLMT